MAKPYRLALDVFSSDDPAHWRRGWAMPRQANADALPAPASLSPTPKCRHELAIDRLTAEQAERLTPSSNDEDRLAGIARADLTVDDDVDSHPARIVRLPAAGAVTCSVRYTDPRDRVLVHAQVTALRLWPIDDCPVERVEA